MQKITQSIYILLLGFILIFSFFTANINYTNKYIYSNNYSVNYVANPQKSDLEQINEIDSYVNQTKDISYYQVTYDNNQMKIIGQLGDNVKQVPKIINDKFQMQALTSLADNGIDGNYYFKGDSTSLENFKQFLTLNNLGSITYAYNQYNFSIQLNVLILIFLIVWLYLILFHSFVNKQSTELSLRLIEGKKTIYTNYLWLLNVGIIFLLLIIILSIPNMQFLKEVLIVFIPIYILIMLSCILILNSALAIVKRNMIAYINQKEQKSIRIYIILSTISFVIICILILKTNTALAHLDVKTAELTQWSDKGEYYVPKIRSIGIENNVDSNEAKENNDKIKVLFKELETDESAMLIDAGGFYNSMSPTKYDYEDNTCEYEWSPNCRQITINENYLKNNPIVNSKNENVLNQINHSPYVLNILVPEKYMSEEEKIIAQYQEYYYFNMVTVHQIYDESYSFDESKLEINPIYYANDATFFTYNPDIGKLENNQLSNVVAVIDNGTFDSSFYYAYITSSLIIKKNDSNFYNELLSYFQNAGVGNQFNGVENINYSIQYTITYLQTMIKYNFIVLILSIFTLLYIVYIISIYKLQNNKMEYAIYYIETKNISKLIRKYLYIEVGIYLSTGAFISLYSRSIIPILLVFLIIIIKYLIETVIGSKYIKNKFLNIAKGER